ncbi:MAG: UxaA family hydrolase [Desulfarculaceae bacterium]|nr:UxaA family hydrolase [Desulfarculaceae bacterium]MCF8072434.1 UxaA family hydrolase [Desulfarculaceae bacterium]MCF8102895.1 UxaA family hydrolase [Desulfarculaceae bacterium]MCF8118477.1 UxaA family hydrolase [Desulfarculaceae bacterium]
MEFYGYPRPDGKVGTRNYVALVPSTGCVNNLCSDLEHLVRGTKALRHDQGCLHPPRDTETVTQTLINLGLNPNVGGALVVALGCEMVKAEEIYEGIKASGKPVEMVVMHEIGGMINTMSTAMHMLVDLVSSVSHARREKADISKLVMGTKCGSSDTSSGLSANLVTGEVCRMLTEQGGRFIQGEICDIMGGEYALKKLAVNPEEGEKIVDYVRDLYMRGLAMGADTRGCQMTAGNVAGGLTTLVEKALGANAKGGQVPIQGALGYGQLVPDAPGRYIMDFPGHGFENLTASAAGGATVHLFTTGRGADTGHPIMPTVKICGNAKTNKTMAEHIDVDVSAVIDETETPDQAGERVLEYMLGIASGRLTKCEILGTESMEILIRGPVI